MLCVWVGIDYFASVYVYFILVQFRRDDGVAIGTNEYAYSFTHPLTMGACKSVNACVSRCRWVCGGGSGDNLCNTSLIKRFNKRNSVNAGLCA